MRLLNKLIIAVMLCSFVGTAHAAALNIDARKSWPEEFRTVGQVVSYYLAPTGYGLYLDEKSSRIAELRIATLPDGNIYPVKQIFLDVIPDGYVLVVDENSKMVSFDYE